MKQARNTFVRTSPVSSMTVTPVAVAEAVRIAKKYDGDDTGAFINGILGSFVRSRNTETDAPQEEAK